MTTVVWLAESQEGPRFLFSLWWPAIGTGSLASCSLPQATRRRTRSQPPPVSLLTHRLREKKSEGPLPAQANDGFGKPQDKTIAIELKTKKLNACSI